MTEETPEITYKPHVRWLIPQLLDYMTFIGKDVFAVGHDSYITFLNFKTGTELVYCANSPKRGDGIDSLAGHRSQIFAFAEKAKDPRILVASYPTFNIIAELRDEQVNRYKALVMMECDLVAAFSGFPNYIVTVWSWRLNQRLIAVNTDIVHRKQIYMASTTQMYLCECYMEGIVVWEVAQCYKKCLMLRRASKPVTGWKASNAQYVGVCWSTDGNLYAIDPSAHLYAVTSDGIDMVVHVEWSEKLDGSNPTKICTFHGGVLIFGPDMCLRSLKKTDKTWKVVWSRVFEDRIERLVSNCVYDKATAWTTKGMVYLISGESEEKIDVTLFTYKQRNIIRIQMIAPEYKYVAALDKSGVLSLYSIATSKLVRMKYVKANDVNFQASPVEPLLAFYGEVGENYGIVLHLFSPDGQSKKVARTCLTHQIVSRLSFSPTGRQLIAAAMSAGEVFIFQVSREYKLALVRYTSVGRGLADCFLMPVGISMRCFILVLFSDKYMIGERIIAIDAETGKDNKFAGKMQGPYARLLYCGAKDTMIGIPHLSRQYHVLKLSGEKGITVNVKMGPIIYSGHEIKYFDAFINDKAFITFAFDGSVVLRKETAPEEYDLKFYMCHRYESGFRNVLIDNENKVMVHLGSNGTISCTYLVDVEEAKTPLQIEAPTLANYDESSNIIKIMEENAQNYLDNQIQKKIQQETRDFRLERKDVVKNFKICQAKLVELLEENIAERPLHQLSLSEFNLHLEAKKERMKQAEWEREDIRVATEAKIRAQDKVTAWIKEKCWDTMLTQRIKICAIFSHYHVENFGSLPSQRDTWPELQKIQALRAIEAENDDNLFRPWVEEVATEVTETTGVIPAEKSAVSVTESQQSIDRMEEPSEQSTAGQPYVLSGSIAHLFVTIPPAMIQQTLAFSYLHMNYLQELVKLNVLNVRKWFNKQFDELMNVKKKEVSLVEERNARLRFILEELNKLSDLRGSFHHLTNVINDPVWKQEEHVEKLIKVEVEECSIEPYISPSQVVIIPPEGGPKDDFGERALMEMMDGVLEKLWHEEIKKPIPKPQCMLDKDPENFNEDDLRLVFDYEAKVKFRNEERDKYRKMLHAEYAKLSQILNEGIVKFNYKVKDMWLTKLKIDSSIGQENLNLMRLRRVNLDRIENDKVLESMRHEIAKLEKEIEDLSTELRAIQDQHTDLQNANEALNLKDRQLDKAFKNHYADLSTIVVDQCFKFYKKRPKWVQRLTMTPTVLYELAQGILTGVRPSLLHPDCFDYFKGLDVLDQISNMPPVMDEGLWTSMCKMRRLKVENETRIRALAQEMVYVENTFNVWSKAIAARRTLLQSLNVKIGELRSTVELTARNKTIQLVLPAGQVEIVTTGHMEDFLDATLIPRVEIEKINNVILAVGALKLRMMKKQTEFRKGILAKEWEHAQMKMKLRHMEQELYSYRRLKIPKELQRYLKEKEEGFTDETDYMRLEKEMEASKQSINKMLSKQMHLVEELELKLNALQDQRVKLESVISSLTVKVSEKKINSDPLAPIKRRQIFKNRMETLMMRSNLIRDVQANHSTIVLLQTELELWRLRTYPTLASFQTY